MAINATVEAREQEVEVGSRVSLPPVLREFCAVVVGLSLLSTLYCLVMHFGFHAGYPYDWPFYLPDQRFGDFTIYEQKFKLFHQAAFFTSGFPFTYPAPMALLYEMLFKLGDTYDLCAFLTVASLGFVVPAMLFGRALWNRGLSTGVAIGVAGIALLLSWPALLLFDRANVEIFVWLALAVGTWAYARNREWTAAAMFGIAASLKLFPFVYLALFLSRRKFGKLLFGAMTFAVTMIASLAILGPTTRTAYAGISNGLAFFQKEYMMTYKPGETGLDHSLLGFVKVIVGAASGNYSFNPLMVKLYLPVTAICGLLLYGMKIRKLPWVNQLLVLTIVAIYFTPFSGDGTLIHLYYPFALCCFLAIEAWRQQVSIRGLRVIFFCFAYLFATESFFVFYGFRYEGQAKCFVLGILLVCALRYPLGIALERGDDDLTHPDARQIGSAL